jgi:hypothetical protein
MSRDHDTKNEARKLTQRKAFYVAAGAADLAMEVLRTLPDRLARLQEKTDLAELSGRAVEYVTVAGARAVQAYDELAERGMQVVGKTNPQQATAQLEQAARSTATVAIEAANAAADAARKSVRTTARAAGQAATAATSAAATAATTATSRRANGQRAAAKAETARPGSADSAKPASGPAGTKPAGGGSASTKPAGEKERPGKQGGKGGTGPGSAK